MSVEDELKSLDQALGELEFRARDDGVLGHLQSGDVATLNRLRTEAKAILDTELGFANDFSLRLHFSSANTLAAVQECRGQIQGALNHIKRRPGIRAPALTPSKPPFVDASRLAALRAAKSSYWDLSRLIRLCEELNAAHANESYISVAMLGRAILDHVPPLFGKGSFAEVANNYAGTTSFKRSMQSLQLSLRNIADGHLHNPIRQKEDLPTATQVDFHKDLDVLLGEILRTLK